MRLQPLAVSGAFLVDSEAHRDERGSFRRAYDAETFTAMGLNTYWPQHNLSGNTRCGTLRGLHWQERSLVAEMPADANIPVPELGQGMPAGLSAGEVKLVRCVRGAVFDVIVDLRPESPSYRAVAAVQLTAQNGAAVYIPAGVAHGFQSLADDTELHYLMGDIYRPELQRGLRFDDPVLGIEWPIPDAIVSDRDRSLPLLSRR